MKNRLIWRIIGLVYLGALAYLLFSAPDKLPTISNWHFIIPADKLVHFCMFFPSPVIMYFSIAKQNSKTWLVLICALVCILFAGGTELLQNLSPTRSMELLDFVADCTGIVLSSVLLPLALKKRACGKSKTRSN